MFAVEDVDLGDRQRDFLTKAEVFEKLKRLAQLHAQGEYTDEEYERLKTGLVDRLTGTSKVAPVSPKVTNRTTERTRERQKTIEREKLSNESFIASSPASVPSSDRPRVRVRTPSSPTLTFRRQARSGSVAQTPIAPRRLPPPEEGEAALRHEFNPVDHTWVAHKVRVRLVRDLMGRGSHKKCYMVADYTPRPCNGADSPTPFDDFQSLPVRSFISRITTGSADDRQKLCREVEAQAYARAWAASYNSCHPPKKIDFLPRYLLELVDRKDQPLCILEEYLSGPFRQYSNTQGEVTGDRNSPQAFSHFAYVASGKRILVCNLQGVNDVFTSPVIVDCAGNQQDRDVVRNFRKNHKCNSICTYLKLPPLNRPKSESEHLQDALQGRTVVNTSKTMPKAAVMPHNRLPFNPGAAGLPPHINQRCCSIL